LGCALGRSFSFARGFGAGRSLLAGGRGLLGCALGRSFSFARGFGAGRSLLAGGRGLLGCALGRSFSFALGFGDGRSSLAGGRDGLFGCALGRGDSFRVGSRLFSGCRVLLSGRGAASGRALLSRRSGLFSGRALLFAGRAPFPLAPRGGGLYAAADVAGFTPLPRKTAGFGVAATLGLP
jgi:hypothetical protein